MTTVNPILNITALLRPQAPGIYLRQWIYDPTWDNPLYAQYTGQKIVPAVGSIIKDPDDTPLWVESVDQTTFIPTYTAIPLSTENDNVVSMLNYGNSTLRLFVDYRNAPYPATPDSKCIFIGKSPRYYTIARYPNTAQESVISQYFDSTGTLVSQMVPLVALDSSQTSWYLPRGHISQQLDHNEEVRVRIFNEDGSEVYNALLFAKESVIINESVIYAPKIVGMTITGNQQLANGTFFLYEKQDFNSLGLQASLVYDDGTTYQVPIDGIKCVLYGQNDFISSFSGLQQFVTIKYFRSENESISSTIADPTGSMISTSIPVTVIPNTLGITTKIMAVPYYNTSTARYIVKYFMYFADGRSAIDVSGYTSVLNGTLVTDSTKFGVPQTFTISVDMYSVDPTNYPVSATYQQTIVIQFGPPNGLVKWTIRDSSSSPYIYGQDNSSSRRPSIRYDSTRQQYFIPSYIFGNKQAFVNSFYTMSSPPFDPSVTTVPQDPTHFVVRDILSGNMIISAPIPIDSYAQAFNVIGDTSGNYLNATVIVEFITMPNSATRKVLFGGPVDVSVGSYVAG